MAICLGLTLPAKFFRQRCRTRQPKIYIATRLMTSSETKTIRSPRRYVQNKTKEMKRHKKKQLISDSRL